MRLSPLSLGTGGRDLFLLLLLPVSFLCPGGGASGWDAAVAKASEIYGGRMHNLFCDNCHSHVARALNIMKYDGSSRWNMIWLCFRMLFCGKFVR